MEFVFHYRSLLGLLLFGFLMRIADMSAISTSKLEVSSFLTNQYPFYNIILRLLKP